MDPTGHLKPSLNPAGFLMPDTIRFSFIKFSIFEAKLLIWIFYYLNESNKSFLNFRNKIIKSKIWEKLYLIKIEFPDFNFWLHPWYYGILQSVRSRSKYQAGLISRIHLLLKKFTMFQKQHFPVIKHFIQMRTDKLSTLKWS